MALCGEMYLGREFGNRVDVRKKLPSVALAPWQPATALLELRLPDWPKA